jgi:hypothetical protein
LSQEKENRNVTVTYPKYQRISNQNFPEEIKIVANSEGKGTQVETYPVIGAFNRIG